MIDPNANRSWTARGPVMFGLFALVILVGGFGAWAFMTTLAGAVVASGQIEVDQNRQVVQHPDGGVVKSIAVDEGDLVESGDLLIQLDPTLLRSELAIVESQLFELMARRGRLEAERDDADDIVFDDELLQMLEEREDVRNLVEGQARLFEARLESLAKETEQLGKRRTQIANQIEGITAQEDALGTQLELIDEERADQQSLLDKGLAQSSRVLQLRREEARMLGTIGELSASKAEANERITEIEIELLKLRTLRREDAITRLRDLQYREFELAEQRRSLIEQLSRLDIRAPVSGIVYGLQVFAPRSVLRPADPVMYLIPQDRPLVIAAKVPPTSVDQVHVGQDVVLRFSAFDSRTTPELVGNVMQVSADSFTDERTNATYYRAEIRLAEGEMDKLPKSLRLVPGMPVDAFIRTVDRTPIAYLFQPFTDYFKRAFRES